MIGPQSEEVVSASAGWIPQTVQTLRTGEHIQFTQKQKIEKKIYFFYLIFCFCFFGHSALSLSLNWDTEEEVVFSFSFQCARVISVEFPFTVEQLLSIV